MRNINYILLLLCAFSSIGQMNFGDQTTLYLGENTSFFFGGDTQLAGDLSLQPGAKSSTTIIAFSNLDLGDNIEVGNILFTGTDDQELFGDSLSVLGNFVVDKQGTLVLMTEQIIVAGGFQTANGVVEAEDEDDILVSGSTNGSGLGYVEGKLVGISQGDAITFPMGINGSPNYVTLNNLPVNTRVSVEIRVPNPDSLFLDDITVGISDEVEWIIKVIGDSVDTEATINFSGVDLQNPPNAQTIRSNAYSPAIVLFSEADTLFHPLTGTVRDGDANFSEGTIISDETFNINSEGRRLAIAIVPVIVDPTFFVPNAFTPNGTLEDNRLFRPYFAGAMINSYSFAVYDSFNQQVYSANQSGDDLDLSLIGWNGILSSGQDAPEGVYYYNVRIEAESEVYTRTGTVLLLK